jgi:TPR repeat protein
MFKKSLLGLCLATMVAGAATAGEFEDANTAYSRGNYAIALGLYRRLANEGVAKAQYMLGVMYSRGNGVQADDGAAAIWFGAFAGASVAGPLEYGLVAAERGDYGTALNLWKPLADKGDHAAQFRIGDLYAAGKGVRRDYVEAAKWYRLSADQGDVNAAFSLGFLFENGWGVAENYAEAARWYASAAARGDAFAQSALGDMYQRGRGVPQDYVLAYMWFNLAAAQSHDGAAAGRNAIAAEMTPEQIAEGQKMTREWKPKSDP